MLVALALSSLVIVAAAPQPVAAQVAIPFTVGSTNDSGDANTGDGLCADEFGGCTLRAAIEEANATPGPDTIGFSIGESSQFTISPTTALPAITETVTIDGYTHPGATENTSAFGDNANLVVQLLGDSSPGSIGLDLSASTGSVVRGLVVNGFERGIQAGEGSVIEGNFVGTDFAGTSAIGNTYGIGVEDVGNVTIGGTTPAARNLISGNSIGILANGNVDNSSILGNYIGTSRSGMTSVSNTTGISLQSNVFGPSSDESQYPNDNRIGDGTDAGRNVISGNDWEGVQLWNNATRTVIQGNYIGVAADGGSVLGNSESGPDTGIVDGTGGFNWGGVVIRNHASDNQIGGRAPGEGNVIANNNNGIVAFSGTGNQFVGNSMYDNVNRGIWLFLSEVNDCR